MTRPPSLVGADHATEPVPDPTELFVITGADGRLVGLIRTIVVTP